MNIGVYLPSIGEINDIDQTLWREADCIACGDYACPRKLPRSEEILQTNETLKKQNKLLYYISPKLSQAHLEGEYQRVIAFMNEGISISINDWGLLYKLRTYIKEEHDISIGRVLTKSIADWYWKNIFLSTESERGRKYLQQNNFNHQIKIDYFKSWGVKGIEVSVDNSSENSYQSINERGLSVIGYVDNSILALARACPASNIEGDGVNTRECKGCKELYGLVPEKKEQRSIYPDILVSGKVIFGKRDVKPNWNGYKRIIYTRGIGKL